MFCIVVFSDFNIIISFLIICCKPTYIYRVFIVTFLHSFFPLLKLVAFLVFVLNACTSLIKVYYSDFYT